MSEETPAFHTFILKLFQYEPGLVRIIISKSNMYRIFIIAVFSLTGVSAFAQQSAFGFCETHQEWNKFRLIADALPAGLNKILVVTTREFDPEQPDGNVFIDDIAENRKVTYIEAACNGEEWLLHPVENFMEGMKVLDPGNDILLFIHGHGKSFNTAITSASQLSARYNVSVIMFDWPARNSNFNKSLARVRRCSDNFYNLLLSLKSYRLHENNENLRISILAHSLGNYFLSYLAVNGNWQYLNEPFIDNIIFNAPAIRTKEHGQVLSLLNFSHRKYVALNKNDRVLRGAQLLTSGKMLGNMIISPKATNTQYADFTGISGKQHNWMLGYHEFEYKTPGIFYFYNTAVHGEAVDFLKPHFSASGENEYLINP